MIPVFNKNGKTIAWLKDSIVFAKDGSKALAFIEQENIFSYSSKHLGIFQNGYFRDKKGDAIAFIKGASGDPFPPRPAIPPFPPRPCIPPEPPTPSVPSVSARASLAWSQTDWEAYINGDG
ncbi:MAG: hypothetical protein H6Q68_279 [Firmicutes bacterium]|nr:hypothetical protein [Bacillota bacterium]